MHIIIERLVALIDQHHLWHEVQRYSGWNRERVVACITMTTSDFEDVCYGASINSYKLYNDADIVISPLVWQRELNRRAVEYRQVADKPLEIQLGLTVEAWCSLYQKDGEFHIGDLGAKDSIQATVDRMFRDNGWIAISTLTEMAHTIEQTPTIGWNHYFEDTNLLRKAYHELNPPQKLAVVWLIVK